MAAEQRSAGGVDRRTFLKGAGVTTGAAVVGYSASSPAAADGHLNPWKDYTVTQSIKDTLTVTSGAAYGIDYLFGTDYTDEAQTRISNYLHRRYGDMRDYSGYTGGEALHTEALTGAIEMQQADEKIFTSIQNNIEASDNVAYAKGQVSLAESLNDGEDLATAKEGMNTTLDDYYSSVQTNLVNHYVTQVEQMWHTNRELYAHSDLTTNFDNSITFFYCVDDSDYNFARTGGASSSTSTEGKRGRAVLTGEWPDGASGGPFEDANFMGYADFELLNGELIESIPVVFWTGSSTDSMTFVMAPYYDNFVNGSNTGDYGTLAEMGEFTSPTGIRTQITDVGETVGQRDSQDDYSGVSNLHFDSHIYQVVMDEIYAARDRVNAELVGYAEDIYNAYEPGEVPIEEIVDPITYATEMSTDNNRGFRQAAASSLGIPTNAQEHVIINIHWPDQEDTEVWTDLFTDHTPTDADGNEVGWQVGTTYSPSSWSEPLFIVWETDDGESEMSQLEEDFTITKAYNTDGTEIESFDNEQTTTHTSDVEQFADQLAALREEQIRMIEKYEENTEEEEEPAGAGAGWFETDGKTLGIVALIGAVLALILGDSGN